MVAMQAAWRVHVHGGQKLRGHGVDTNRAPIWRPSRRTYPGTYPGHFRAFSWSGRDDRFISNINMVRTGGVEPTRVSPRDFKSLASTIPPRPRAAVVAPRGCPAKPCLTAPPLHAVPAMPERCFLPGPVTRVLRFPTTMPSWTPRDVRQDDPAPYRSSSAGDRAGALRSCARSSPVLGSEQPKSCA